MNTDCLIHAVCGAGKTEITFEAISMLLKKGEYIAFAIPRIDILYEVYERLVYYFPKTKVCILNSQEAAVQGGQIYVITTNQMIKFKEAFSLIIVDEIDAYPYEHNAKYDFGVQKAKKNKGIIIYLTSTPSTFILSKKIPTYIINRRWHGHKLPIPKFQYFDINLFLKYGDKKFINNLKSYNNSKKRQLLVFVSNINIGYEIVKKVKEEKVELDFVYANNLNRQRIIKEFSQEKTKVLLTTTILERGVTFNNIDVIVLDSSSKLYTVASLIQISGRVRRKKEYQEGNVYFFYNDITKQMIQCKKVIEKFNL